MNKKKIRKKIRMKLRCEGHAEIDEMKNVSRQRQPFADEPKVGSMNAIRSHNSSMLSPTDASVRIAI